VRLGNRNADRRHPGERRFERRAALEVDAQAGDRHQLDRRVGIDALVAQGHVGQIAQEARIVVLLA
jgi:hypothetical protein